MITATIATMTPKRTLHELGAILEIYLKARQGNGPSVALDAQIAALQTAIRLVTRAVNGELI
jgi:hypothetical protein